MRFCLAVPAFLLVLLAPPLWDGSVAGACGCFSLPDPLRPVVQEGEQIVFVVGGGVVTAIVQIRYQGPAQDFGWLLPLPSQPTLGVGRNTMFNELAASTQPQFTIAREREECPPPQRSSGLDCGHGDSSPGGGWSTGEPPAAGGPSPLVLQDTIGPYTYAVLRADTRQPMLDWLKENRYFVPATPTDVLAPYIRPGAFFLALKLSSGKAAGDIEPVILTYPSDLPMIPLILTSASTVPRLPITVWVFGRTRAIPRNWHHTVLNDAALAWEARLGNYSDVVAQAVAEAPNGRSFVTEFSGSTESLLGGDPDLAGLRTGSPWVTRLHTRVAAGSMTSDPVFGFNADLPPVGREQYAIYRVACTSPNDELKTPSGFRLPFTGPKLAIERPKMPSALRTEILREAGPPEVVKDNRESITRALARARPVPPSSTLGANRSPRPLRPGVAPALLALFLPPALIAWRRLRRGRGREDWGEAPAKNGQAVRDSR